MISKIPPLGIEWTPPENEKQSDSYRKCLCGTILILAEELSRGKCGPCFRKINDTKQLNIFDKKTEVPKCKSCNRTLDDDCSSDFELVFADPELCHWCNRKGIVLGNNKNVSNSVDFKDVVVHTANQGLKQCHSCNNYVDDGDLLFLTESRWYCSRCSSSMFMKN